MSNPASSLHRDFLIFNLLIPLLFFGFTFFFMPINQTFMFDTDEGIELIRAQLYSEGFDLYTQIWSDHPPFLTVLLSGWLQLWGHSVVNARLLNLSFATALVWSFGQIVRMTVGVLPAILSVIWLTVSFQFLRMSSSIMIGLPSLTLAVLAIHAFLVYQNTLLLRFLGLSAIAVALSLQTKIFTAFLGPILGLYWLLSKRDRLHQFTLKLKDLWVPMAWSILVLLFFLISLPLLEAPSIQQTITLHFEEGTQSAFGWPEGYGQFLTMIGCDIDYWFLALFGIVSLVKQKAWFRSIPLLWLVTALLLLNQHRPLWYHHYQLLGIPLIWLAAIGLSFILEKYQVKPQAWRFKKIWNQRGLVPKLALICLIFSGVAIPIKLISTHALNQYSFIRESQAYFEMLNHIQEHQTETKWLFTDYPIYGFYADLNIPPEIAVFSKKRLLSGHLSVEELTNTLNQYQPEQVVLGRFPEVREMLREPLENHYIQTYANSTGVHYLRKAELTQAADGAS